MEVSKILDKYFKKEGIDALTTRMNTLIRLFNDNKFPFDQKMLGFGQLTIADREECFGRIIELSDILHRQFKLNKISDGEKIIGFEIKV